MHLVHWRERSRTDSLILHFSATLWSMLVRNVSYSTTNHVKVLKWEGGLHYEKIGGTRQQIQMKPLKETNLGMAQPLFDS